MRKTLPFLAVAMLFGTLATTGCVIGGVPGGGGSTSSTLKMNVSGGTEAEQTAIQQAINQKIITLSGIEKMKGNGVVNELRAAAESDGGINYLKLTTKQTQKIKGVSYHVNLSYDIVEGQGPVKSYYSPLKYDPLLHDGEETRDDLHKRVDLVYPEFGGTATTWSFRLKASCGDAATSDDGIEFKFKLNPQEVQYDDVSIAELLGSTDDKFNKVNYNKTTGTPYYYSNHNQKYYFIRTWGEVEYYSPDGDFAIIRDGDNYMELFAGNGEGTPLRPQEHEYLRKGAKVYVSGSMSAYLGNMQMSYVSSVVPYTGATQIAAKTSNVTINQALLNKYKDGNFHKQAAGTETLMNAMGTITGTYVAGSLKNKGGTAVSSITRGERATFEIQIATGEKITVAYDYHVNEKRTASEDTVVVDVNYTKLNDIFKSENAGKTVTISGTMRYEIPGVDSKQCNNFGGQGYWRVSPLTANDVTIA